MSIDWVRDYFMNKPGAVEERPFNEHIPVFKVGGKMFALINCYQPNRPSINLKYFKEVICDLRDSYEEIQPGYHMNKSHWNTVYLDGSLEEEFIKELIDISYGLVFGSLTVKKQKEINEVRIDK